MLLTISICERTDCHKSGEYDTFSSLTRSSVPMRQVEPQCQCFEQTQKRANTSNRKTADMANQGKHLTWVASRRPAISSCRCCGLGSTCDKGLWHCRIAKRTRVIKLVALALVFFFFVKPPRVIQFGALRPLHFGMMPLPYLFSDKCSGKMKGEPLLADPSDFLFRHIPAATVHAVRSNQ